MNGDCFCFVGYELGCFEVQEARPSLFSVTDNHMTSHTCISECFYQVCIDFQCGLTFSGGLRSAILTHQSLKVREAKCIPGDPAITCPGLFKGSRSPLVLA